MLTANQQAFRIRAQCAPFGKLKPGMTFARPLSSFSIEPKNRVSIRAYSVEFVEKESDAHEILRDGLRRGVIA